MNEWPPYGLTVLVAGSLAMAYLLVRLLSRVVNVGWDPHMRPGFQRYFQMALSEDHPIGLLDRCHRVATLSNDRCLIRHTAQNENWEKIAIRLEGASGEIQLLFRRHELRGVIVNSQHVNWVTVDADIRASIARVYWAVYKAMYPTDLKSISRRRAL